MCIAGGMEGSDARAKGAGEWLDQVGPAEFNVEGLLGAVGTLIIGRKTCDQVMEFGDWPYEDRRTIVLTSRDLPDNRPANTEAYGGSLVELASQLRDDRSDTGDIWIVGGASVVTQILFCGLVDQVEMFIIPEILGGGIRVLCGGGIG